MALRWIGLLCRASGKALSVVGVVAVVLILWLAATSSPLLADGTVTFGGQPAASDSEDFGKYLADHQADLAPFFIKNAEDLFKLAVPLAMGMTGWVILFTMLMGWGIDVLMSRGFAFFFAPAFADLKRSVIYATGRLFLSFVYTCLMGLAIVFSLGLAHAGIVITVVVCLLLLVAFAAQIVWILYLYRTDFAVSALFYVAVVVVHVIAGFLIAQPIMGSRASSAATNFVDTAITPKLRAESESMNHELAAVRSARDVVKAKVAECQNQIAQAQTEAERLRQEIEAKKNSDIFVFGQIVKVHAAGDLDSARGQLTAFLTRFPSSPLDAVARTQLAEVNNQMAVEATQKNQAEVNAARAAAQARADLLARAGRGEVTLSEMRQALIGKTRAQVSSLLGLPSETASDSWGYRQQMILNPLTNEKHGLTIYFTEGIVQSVDYDRNGGPQ
jgi:DNA-binding transcriptional regulator YdaS (Cro superfamily)